ncbi:MAG TPA: hypothetical protein VGM24_11390 [Puia sp.]|jgi:hypothetical protein
MKRIILLMMLVTSIKESLFAQENPTVSNTDKKFELSSDKFTRRFLIDLGKGNKLQIELKDMADLDRLKNMDSILRVFLQEIEPLRDSLSDELSSKRIDYTMDSMGRKEIRIQQFRPKGSNFLINKGDLASLKLEQDTVNFIGTVHFIAKYTLRKAFPDQRKYQVSFFVNQLNELPSILAAGLNDKILSLQQNVNSGWKPGQDGRLELIKDPRISAKLPKGYFTGHGDYLSPDISVNVQNYKSYFVPSVSLGIRMVLSNGSYKREIGLLWEPHFLFQNGQGRLKTFRNDFLSLTFGQGPIKDNDPLKESSLQVILSAGYLVRRQGDYFDKHTIRLGFGRLSLFEGKTKIEPMIFFHDFFREVTPGIRWIQSI